MSRPVPPNNIARIQSMIDAALAGFSSQELTCVILEGSSSSASVSSLDLASGGGTALTVGSLGIPVDSSMTGSTVAVSFLAESVPAGDWTLTLHKSSGDGHYSPVATFTISH